MTRYLTVSRKTGFRVTDPHVPINIRDYRGILFYSTESMVPDVLEFNLPAGKYLVDTGSFSPMEKPISFLRASLPVSERAFARTPYNFKMMFDDNPNKASIFWAQKIIIFDKRFLDAPLPQLFFIYFHELGHSRYGYSRLYDAKEAEKYCDLWASNKMLEMGFNPSQILLAPKETLSNSQNYRKDFIQNTLEDNAFQYE